MNCVWQLLKCTQDGRGYRLRYDPRAVDGRQCVQLQATYE